MFPIVNALNSLAGVWYCSLSMSAIYRFHTFLIRWIQNIFRFLFLFSFFLLLGSISGNSLRFIDGWLGWLLSLRCQKFVQWCEALFISFSFSRNLHFSDEVHRMNVWFRKYWLCQTHLHFMRILLRFFFYEWHCVKLNYFCLKKLEYFSHGKLSMQKKVLFLSTTQRNGEQSNQFS